MTTKQTEPQVETLTRRNFLKLGLGTLGSLAMIEMSGASLLFMQPRSLDGQFGGVVVAGLIDSFPVSSATEFPDGRFYLIRADNGGFLAVYTRCTHLGCTVNWQPQQNQFFCPCHASSFDAHGTVENPPASRPLDTFPVTIQDGQVLVDTAHITQRNSYTSDQLVFA